MDYYSDRMFEKDSIIDIRKYSEYLNGHIKGAISIEEKELVSKPMMYLNKEKTYYIYCNHGNRSRICVNYLNSLGYHTVNIDGGYANYLLR